MFATTTTARWNHRTRHVVAGMALATATAIGSGVVPARAGSSPPPADGGYAATLTRDAAGVAHITAADWGSLGYGQGYALAEDRACTLLDLVVKVRGERAHWFGAGENDEHINSDFAYRHLGLWADAPERWADQSPRVRNVIAGYVAGFNDQIAGAGLDGWCAGEPWAEENTEITTQDLYAYVSDILLLASSQNLIEEIGRAQPPAPAPPGSAAPSASEPAGFTMAPIEAGGASNGWAIGADVSSTDGGLLLGNPHFPWEGELRFWESHLTIPGELDVYGVGLTGLPGVQIGFNDAIAWTHTVSAGHRFTLYHYELDPADPTVYLVDGEAQTMTATDYTIDVLGDDGTTTELTRTMYATHHGPVVDVDPLGWTTDMAIAIRDANIDISTVLEQYFGMDAATSMDEFQAVHEELQGVPWVNTISVSADGRAWLADVSATPNLSPEAIDAWLAEREAGGLAALVYDQAGVVMLDGSNSLFDWVDDPQAPAPGLIPWSQVPQLERTDYVFNANDSFWFQHPDQLLTGYSPLSGAGAQPQSPRTRLNAMILAAADDWDIDDVQTALFSDRASLSELLLPALVEACQATPTVDVDGAAVDVGKACAVLAAWDGTFTNDAVGAVIFREWLSRFSWADRTDAGRLFADAFDPADPAGTPSTPVDDRTDWLVELAATVTLLEYVGIPLDTALGDLQFEVRSGEQLPIHGGTNIEGAANIVGCCGSGTVLQALPDTGEPIGEDTELRLLDGRAVYPVSSGTSFVYTVQFGPDGPVADGILTYGNPDNPDDPAYSAGLQAFSNGEWRPLALGEPPVGEVTELSAPRR